MMFRRAPGGSIELGESSRHQVEVESNTAQNSNVRLQDAPQGVTPFDVDIFRWLRRSFF